MRLSNATLCIVRSILMGCVSLAAFLVPSNVGTAARIVTVEILVDGEEVAGTSCENQLRAPAAFTKRVVAGTMNASGSCPGTLTTRTSMSFMTIAQVAPHPNLAVATFILIVGAGVIVSIVLAIVLNVRHTHKESETRSSR